MARQYRKLKRYGVLVEDEFFAALSGCANITKACRMVDMPMGYVWKNRIERPDFAERYDEAMKKGLQALEDKALEYAFDGIPRGVYYQGNKVGEEKEPSERLIEFVLKANKPEKYRENATTFNIGANSLVQVLSGMPRSDVLEEKVIEQEAIEAPNDGASETRSPSAD
jgi:hypothetical protein